MMIDCILGHKTSLNDFKIDIIKTFFFEHNGRRKEIMRIRREINRIENRKTMKQRADSLKKINKITKLGRQRKNERSLELSMSGVKLRFHEIE